MLTVLVYVHLLKENNDMSTLKMCSCKARMCNIYIVILHVVQFQTDKNVRKCRTVKFAVPFQLEVPVFRQSLFVLSFIQK